MTDRELAALASQLRTGALGYRRLAKAMKAALVGDAAAINRLTDRVDAIQRELDDLAGLVESAPEWLRKATCPRAVA